MNQELAEIFYEIADILEMKKVQWKPQAYRKAARSLESLGENVKDIYKEKGFKGLTEIPGVGEGIAKKIVQFIETGKVIELEKLKKKIPEGLADMMKVPGLGAKRALKLYKRLGIKSIKKLEEAAKKHEIQNIETFKEKSEENILKGIEFLKRSKGRVLLGYALPIARYIESQLKTLKEVKKAVSAGSLRRREETIGDIDILIVASNAEPVVKFFTEMPVVERVLAKGKTKAVIITKDDIQVDARIIKPESFGSALQYFTGNKEHNIHLRRLALKKGLKLSEYGLFKGKKQIAGKTEKEVYNKLGMCYIEPELRTDSGEIEAALKKKLPKLVGYDNIKGDFHVHSKWSDGSDSIEEIAKTAKDNGLSYIAICDHAGHLKIAHSLDEKRIEKQGKEIDKINKKLSEIKILKGAEVDIMADGTLSLKNSALKKLDIVIASIHSGFRFPKEKQTERILKAMDNPYVNILGHPTGRLIQRRESYEIDLEKICEKAKERKIALEINANPERFDLNDANVKEAIAKGAKLAIGTDSHSKTHLSFLELGAAIARRGWAEKKDILNCLSLKQLMKFLRKT